MRPGANVLWYDIAVMPENPKKKHNGNEMTSVFYIFYNLR
jgi:hypothetical protein